MSRRHGQSERQPSAAIHNARCYTGFRGNAPLTDTSGEHLAAFRGCRQAHRHLVRTVGRHQTGHSGAAGDKDQAARGPRNERADLVGVEGVV